MRPGVKIKLWTGGFTNRPSVDAPWLLKFVSVLAILSIVGVIVYGAAMAIGGPGVAEPSAEEAMYISILHFLLPIAIVYTVTANSPLSRVLIFGYFVTLYVSTINGKGFLGSLAIDPGLRIAASTGVLLAITLWLSASPKMRFYYALISGRAVPGDLESQAASFMDDSKLNPKWRVAIDWLADHLETIVLLGFTAVAIYASVTTGA